MDTVMENKGSCCPSKARAREVAEMSNVRTSYRPIIIIFIISLFLSFSLGFSQRRLMGFFLANLALLKLIDLEGFLKGFKKYDLLAKRIPEYGYLYGFFELIIAGLLLELNLQFLYKPMALVSLFIGGVGTVSVVKSVYIEKKSLTCACVGAEKNVPLGFISLVENLMMFGVAFILWN